MSKLNIKTGDPVYMNNKLYSLLLSITQTIKFINDERTSETFDNDFNNTLINETSFASI